MYKGTFSTGGFSSYCTQSDYMATIDNEGTMNFDGAHNEFSTFAMPVFNNKGTLVIDHCYNFSIDGVLVNTGTIFLSNVAGFGGKSEEIDNTNGTIVYDHNSQIGGSLLKKLKGLGGTVMTKEAYEQVKPQTFPITYELDGGVYFKDPAFRKVNAFYCPGGLNYEKMPFLSKLMMRALLKSLRAKKDKTETDQEMIKMISGSYDISDKKYIEPILACLK